MFLLGQENGRVSEVHHLKVMTNVTTPTAMIGGGILVRRSVYAVLFFELSALPDPGHQ